MGLGGGGKERERVWGGRKLNGEEGGREVVMTELEVREGKDRCSRDVKRCV